MVKRLRRSARAEQDLIEIWNFIAKDNETAADRIFDLLVAKSELVARSPTIGRLRKEIGEDIRSTLAGSWSIFYRVHPNHVEILRYLHTRRRMPEVL
ncbi:MAG: plasmid stabilization protein [Methylocystis sp.]|nr:MAG: plasmid stabilization protein [Methylocystis sp.]